MKTKKEEKDWRKQFSKMQRKAGRQLHYILDLVKLDDSVKKVLLEDLKKEFEEIRKALEYCIEKKDFNIKLFRFTYSTPRDLKKEVDGANKICLDIS